MLLVWDSGKLGLYQQTQKKKTARWSFMKIQDTITFYAIWKLVILMNLIVGSLVICCICCFRAYLIKFFQPANVTRVVVVVFVVVV